MALVKQKVSTNKCARKFDHVYPKGEYVMKTRTHTVKQCERCKGKTWVPNRDE